MKEVLCACFKIVVVFLHIGYAYKSPQSRIFFEIGLRRTGTRRSPTRQGSQLRTPTLTQYPTRDMKPRSWKSCSHPISTLTSQR
ncbi:hypothetical protein BKA60DRAFT_565339 [Fusarium oxysporum]|nr:hypothetical protein BKA60DRAFT_565339 [Fusarium oxysporum]